jgi:hypothetical protein
METSKAQEEDGSSDNEQLDTDKFEKPKLLFSSVEVDDEELPPFLYKQKSKLLQVRDSLLDLMTGVSRDTLRSRAEDNEASGLGMHQADAGSDAYDRDFALNLDRSGIRSGHPFLKRLRCFSVGDACVVLCQKKEGTLNGSHSAVKQGHCNFSNALILRVRGHLLTSLRRWLLF